MSQEQIQYSVGIVSYEEADDTFSCITYVNGVQIDIISLPAFIMPFVARELCAKADDPYDLAGQFFELNF